jgi:hypothetical protein
VASKHRRALWALLGVMGAGCSGQGPSVVPTEPLLVTNGQFIAGPMPGALASAAMDAGTPGSRAPLSITQVSVPVLPIAAGEANESLSGEATSDAVAVGVEVANSGTGYWVAPVGATDPNFPGQISFGFNANFNATDGPGTHTLRFVAIDGSGRGGTYYDAPVCIKSIVPDNGHSCNAASAPPAAVISLSWDTNFNLDLDVVTPAEVELTPQSPAGPVPPDAGTGKLPVCTPAIDRDSLANCVPDGMREEDLVFQCPPVPGIYHIYVDPFAACGQPAVHFTLTVYTLAGTCPDCGLQAVYSLSGELLASQVTGGASMGLFVHDQIF